MKNRPKTKYWYPMIVYVTICMYLVSKWLRCFFMKNKHEGWYKTRNETHADSHIHLLDIFITKVFLIRVCSRWYLVYYVFLFDMVLVNFFLHNMLPMLKELLIENSRSTVWCKRDSHRFSMMAVLGRVERWTLFLP